MRSNGVHCVSQLKESVRVYNFCIDSCIYRPAFPLDHALTDWSPHARRVSFACSSSCEMVVGRRRTTGEGRFKILLAWCCFSFLGVTTTDRTRICFSSPITPSTRAENVAKPETILILLVKGNFHN